MQICLTAQLRALPAAGGKVGGRQGEARGVGWKMLQGWGVTGVGDAGSGPVSTAPMGLASQEVGTQGEATALGGAADFGRGGAGGEGNLRGQWRRPGDKEGGILKAERSWLQVSEGGARHALQLEV